MSDTVQAPPAPAPTAAPRVSRMAEALVGSEILRISAEIRGISASGRAVCDLTVGDFSPRQFPIPDALSKALSEAVANGETNYPPASGMRGPGPAVAAFYASELGLDSPTESVLIAGGSRPLIYGVYRRLCDPGDGVVY